MAGVVPLPPLDILQLAERLQWPCEPDECLAIIRELDNQFLEKHNK